MKHNQTENEKPKSCQINRYDELPCGRNLYDNKHCIFHSKDIDGKKIRFEEEFWKEYERQKKEENEVYDFSRFVFPESISFEKKEFKKSTYFIETKFFGEFTNFSDTKFLGEFTCFGSAKFEARVTSFERAKFSGSEIHFGTGIIYKDVLPYNVLEIKFSGCIFSSDNNNFSYAKFLSDLINFRGTKFSGKNIDFFEAEFAGNTEFCEFSPRTGISYDAARFESENTDLRRVKFRGENTDFSKTTFSGEKTMFSEAEFLGKNTDFSKTTFSREVYFGPTHWWELDWIEAAKFSGENVNFRETQFLGEKADFNNVEFSVKKIDFYNSNFRNVEGLFEALSYRTKFLKRKYKIKDFRFKLGEESATRYPLIKRITQDAWYLADFKRQHPYVYAAWKSTSDCGRSIMRWAIFSLIIALFFGAIYADYSCPSWLEWMNYNNLLEKINPIMVINQPTTPQKTPHTFASRIKTSFTPYYFSIVTFTTLGFGDITPINKAGEIWLAIEVILGYLMLGGLISIFAVKLARRS